jgi:hypothetical protein
VLRRDKYACRYCGSAAPEAQLTVDHVVPTALGGHDGPSNLVAACTDCNSGKTSTSPSEELVADVADMDMEAMRRRAELWDALRDYHHASADEWIADFERSHWGRVELPPDWRNTVIRWYLMGVPWWVIFDADAATIKARANRPWSYFCGIVWKLVRELNGLESRTVDQRISARISEATRAGWGHAFDFLGGYASAYLSGRLDNPDERAYYEANVDEWLRSWKVA